MFAQKKTSPSGSASSTALGRTVRQARIRTSRSSPTRAASAASNTSGWHTVAP